ncbi:MAG TPA: phosphatidylglycerol lysyltransferase domain-containing protein [Nitrospira sp.]|nr:phosphatidylglycerol lysyltransferase domain-containing protein [Nitrospira sp.]
MGSNAAESEQTTRVLPQFVSGSACFRCDVCCRFPEGDSFLRPYFTRDEITEAVAQGIPDSFFPDQTGSQINLVQNSGGEGYLCPAFNAESGHCGIYNIRPLDCQLYPLALMWDASGQEVLLGWDTKCPFMREAIPDSIRKHAAAVTTLLSTEVGLDKLVANPRLIGRFQDDVVVLKPLPQLTAHLRVARVDPCLRPLTLSDAPRMAHALARAEMLHDDAPAAFAFPYHYIWTSLLPCWWLDREDTLFLFAQSPDGWFMPLPPLGSGALDRAVDDAFRLMHQWNGPSPVSRIEHVTDAQRQLLNNEGVQFRKKDGDYLYSASALATLMGDSYKSQRALCNRAEREQSITLEPYRSEYRDACRSLHRRWADQKRRGQLDEMGTFLLEDSESAHIRVFRDYEQIGLLGTVVKVNHAIAAYTFGYWLTPHTWCILFEVADRAIPGLAQWLFRETCRSAMARGAASINAMDDAGLPGLRAAKVAYHPTAVVTTWIATRTTP